MAPDLPVEHPALSRVARGAVSPAGRGARQLARGRADAHHLRSHREPALSRRAHALCRRRAACRVTDPDPSLLTASRRSSRTSSCAARTGSSSAASSSSVSAIAGRPSTPSTRLQREDDSPARVRARHRLVRDPTRVRALAGVVRDGQEPLGPSDRFRRDPTRSSRRVPGGPRPPRGARDAQLAGTCKHDVAQVTAVQLLPFDEP